jgi:hypothetical protein
MWLCRGVDDGAKSNAALFIADLIGVKSFASQQVWGKEGIL